MPPYRPIPLLPRTIGGEKLLTRIVGLKDSMSKHIAHVRSMCLPAFQEQSNFNSA